VNITSVLAPNPGWFTGPGTNTYLVDSDGDLVIIDPGPEIPEHVEAVVRATAGRRVVGVLVTHTHPDHAPAANGLGNRFDVPVFGFGPGPAFEPSHRLGDGDEVAVGRAALIAVHTPGHTPDHLCFLAGDSLFTGDHIMGGSTVIIEDAVAYMQSLHKVAGLGANTIYPGHGPILHDAGEVIAGYVEHRRMRENQILASLHDGASSVGDLVREIYHDVDPALHPAAAAQVIVQLRKLADEGRVSFIAGGAGLETSVSVSKETES
jgi:glyoxylase-like metal-dependent hydrolase (beta-lactamase superfamily II)